MAKINVNNIEHINKNITRVHNEVSSSYDVFVINGKKYFQLDTYGSSNRMFRGKVSQSIQIDYDSAEALICLLTKHFVDFKEN